MSNTPHTAPAASAPATQEPLEAARQGIEQAYAKYFGALKAGDGKEMASLLAPGFRWETLEETTLGQDEAAALLESFAASVVSVESAEAEVSELSLQGDEATFVVQETIIAIVHGEEGQPSKARTIESFRDTMVLTPQGWKFVRAQTLSSQSEPLPLEEEA